MHLWCFPPQVEGINGMYLANKLLDSHVKTFITYNKGQTWALLPAPAADVAGNNLHCILVSSSLWAGVNECSCSCEMKLMTYIIHQMFQPHQLCSGCSLIQSHIRSILSVSLLNGWGDARLEYSYYQCKAQSVIAFSFRGPDFPLTSVISIYYL